jgi:hypothetical protein
MNKEAITKKDCASFEDSLHKLVMEHAKKCPANWIVYSLVNHAAQIAYANEPHSGMAHYLICRALQDGIALSQGLSDEYAIRKKGEPKDD